MKNWLKKLYFTLPPRPTAPPPHAPERATLLLLATLVGIAVTTHFLLGHPIVAGFGLLVWGLKTAAILRVGRMPPRWLIVFLTVCSFLMVLVFYGGWNGQKAGISFLVLLASLKFLESHNLRDYYLVCLILFFLASSSFLFNSSILSIVVVLCFTLCVLMVMLRLSDPHRASQPSVLKLSTAILLKALPLTIVLFFFFPRIHGSFGFLPSQDELSGDNQLDNALVAGDFAAAAFNNEPAFRVEFEGETPANSMLYWRVKTMVDERNFTWQVRPPRQDSIQAATARPARAQPEDLTVKYQIVHEPSDDSFIPYLDFALNPDLGVQLDDHSVYVQEPRSGVFAYPGEASIRPNLTNVTTDPQLDPTFLQTSRQPSARTLALLSTWQREASTTQQRIAAVLGYFRENRFSYSLTPPSLGNEPLDEFLFETRTGYCEHFASTFTLLMRYLQIPSRVVVGFQGGTMNPIGGYLQVRYSDAHAWSEVWLDGRWQRIDPTTMAAMGEQRINNGMDALMSLWEQGLWENWDGSQSLTDFLRPGGIDRTIQQLQDYWDNVGHQWNKWVINYDFNAQRRLLENLGVEHRNTLYSLVGILFAACFALVLFYFWQLVPKPIKREPAQAAYLEFVHKLERFGLRKLAAETPNQFAERAAQAVPQLAPQIKKISALYVQLRYGPQAVDLDDFKSHIKRFKPSPKNNLSRKSTHEKSL